MERKTNCELNLREEVSHKVFSFVKWIVRWNRHSLWELHVSFDYQMNANNFKVKSERKRNWGKTKKVNYWLMLHFFCSRCASQHHNDAEAKWVGLNKLSMCVHRWVIVDMILHTKANESCISFNLHSERTERGEKIFMKRHFWWNSFIKFRSSMNKIPLSAVVSEKLVSNNRKHRNKQSRTLAVCMCVGATSLLGGGKTQKRFSAWRWWMQNWFNFHRNLCLKTFFNIFVKGKTTE